MAKMKTMSSKDYGMIFLVMAILLVLALTVYVVADGMLHRTNLLTDKSLINSTAAILGKYPANITQKDLDEIKILVIEKNPYGGDGYTLSFGYDDALAMIKRNEADSEALRLDPDYEVDESDERSVEDLLLAEISEDNIKDFSDLSRFTNLEYLIFSGPNLQYTSESMNELKDFSFIENLKSLTNINISNTGAYDFAPVAGLPALKSLSVIYNAVKDTSVLSNAVGLEFLNLTIAGISDISFVAPLVNLKDLYIRYNTVEDISALQGLSNLRDLVLDSNEIEDISPLKSLTNLKTLNLNGNKIKNIGVLSSLASLENLYLGSNEIEDITPAYTSSSLVNLSISANHLTETGMPENAGTRFKALKILDISENEIEDISPLSGITSLETLYAGTNMIVDVGPLAPLVNLSAAYLDDNLIEDFSPLDALEEAGTYISGRGAQQFDEDSDYDFDFDFDYDDLEIDYGD